VFQSEKKKREFFSFKALRKRCVSKIRWADAWFEQKHGGQEILFSRGLGEA
jgi:hypothetical protein